MLEEEGIGIKGTIESFIRNHANEQSFWKLSLEQMIFCFWSQSPTNREGFDFHFSDG